MRTQWREPHTTQSSLLRVYLHITCKLYTRMTSNNVARVFVLARSGTSFALVQNHCTTCRVPPPPPPPQDRRCIFTFLRFCVLPKVVFAHHAESPHKKCTCALTYMPAYVLTLFHTRATLLLAHHVESPHKTCTCALYVRVDALSHSCNSPPHTHIPKIK